MTKLCILSDLHTEFRWTEPMKLTKDWMPKHDLALFAGDIGKGVQGFEYAKKLSKKFVYIAGNHEYYDGKFTEINDSLEEIGSSFDARFLNDSSVLFPEFNLCVIGCTLWTDFNLYGDQTRALFVAQNTMNDFRLIKNGYPNSLMTSEDSLNRHKGSIYFLQAELRWAFDTLAPEGYKICVLTHHAPSIKSIHPRYGDAQINAAFASRLDETIMRKFPDIDLWVHGHTHDSFDYMVGKTRVIANPRGYPGENPTWAPIVIDI